jgi:hypothetical protein
MGLRSTGWTILSTALALAFLGWLMEAPAAQAPPGAQIPRTADGRPNLAGIWQAVNAASWDIEDHHADAFPGLPNRFAMPGGRGVVEGGALPYQPAAAAKKRENFAKRDALDPEAKCFLPGVPRIMYMPHPFQIVQTAKQITMLFEYLHATRNVFMDSPHPKGPIEWWMGDSRGRWEGDVLVVDVVHFNDQTWFDRAGNHHSDALHLVERYSLITPDHINYEVTVEDPKVFTRPWKMTMPLYRRKEAGAQILDFECYTFGEDGALSFGPR